jgi:arylsulfatase A-like enzyme
MRLSIIAAALLCTVRATDISAAAPTADRPNIVFVLIDDLGARDLGCYGSRFYSTPHLNQLAAQGLRFDAAYAACTVCSPTRASIMTGRYPARLHLTDWIPGQGPKPTQPLRRPDWRPYLPLDEVALPKVLKTAGYTSACIGKWHLGGSAYSPERHGFDLNRGGSERGSTPSHFSPYRLANLQDGPKGEYLTDRLTREATDFMTANKDRPFFLYLAHYSVHIPMQAKPEIVQEFQKRVVPGDPQNNAVYAAMLRSVDDSVGTILQKLDELKIADRTLVIFTSDNGGLVEREGPHTPPTSNAPLRAGKGFLYEGGIRVPLIIRGPGIAKPGSVVDVPVSSVDFFPTLIEVTGAKASSTVDGTSLVPLLQGQATLSRDAIYWHYPHYVVPGGSPSGAVRQGDYKLIEFYEDGHTELYNLREDGSEKANLTHQLPDKAKKLQQKLKNWRAAVDAQMPTPNPAYKP